MKLSLYKIWMIVILSLSIIFSIMVFSSCESDSKENLEETLITVKDLPKNAITFINQYFSGKEISKIEREQDNEIYVYEVYFSEGDEIVFNSEGEWQQVVAPSGMTIPSGIAPDAIVDYLDENYPGYGIMEINKTGYGYKIELVTELDLMFNELGQFIGLENQN